MWCQKRRKLNTLQPFPALEFDIFGVGTAQVTVCAFTCNLESDKVKCSFSELVLTNFCLGERWMDASSRDC